MTDSLAHLTEDERQMLADDSLPAEQRQHVEAHVRRCGECSADVARLRALMTRIHESLSPVAPVDDLWPAIRDRIETRKILSMSPTASTSAAAEIAPRGRHTARWLAALGAVAAAAVLFVVATARERTDQVNRASELAPPDPVAQVIQAVDSAQAYEVEAQTLLNRLELQRARLRPDAADALQHDLRSIDTAIAELKEAIARDPNNPALRQLLASSYRQKVDLLRRVANAG
jgi:anti-sigma factor RsiW